MDDSGVDRQDTTNEKGTFRIKGVPPGSYIIAAYQRDEGQEVCKRPKWAVLTGVVFGQVSIKKSSRHIRRYEDKSQGALISSV
jgi:hypothetical protein